MAASAASAPPPRTLFGTVDTDAIEAFFAAVEARQPRPGGADVALFQKACAPPRRPGPPRTPPRSAPPQAGERSRLEDTWGWGVDEVKEALSEWSWEQPARDGARAPTAPFLASM